MILLGKPCTARLRRLVVLAAALLSILAWAACDADAASPRPPAMAAQPHPLLDGLNIPSIGAYSSLQAIGQVIAYAHTLHATVVRTDVAWSIFEPRAPGQIDAQALAETDRLVADAAAVGIRVIMTVDNTPCWASSAPSSVLLKCSTTSEGEANAWPPTNSAEYANFVAFLAQRYGAHLAAIEIWNEPDQSNERYLAGPEKPKHYAAILRAAYPAIKRVNPNVPVLGGSLVGSNGLFLRALYAAGIKGYYDGLAVHYYNLTLASLRSIRETQLANGDTTPLWLDEFGWSSCWPRQREQQEQACVTSRIQATNFRNTLRSLARTPYVAAAIVYKLQDTRSENFGLLSSSGTRKPAFVTVAGVFASPFGSLSPVSLSLHRRGGRVLATGSAPVGDFMELEVFQGTVLRYRALFTLNRFNRYSLTLPAVLGTNGLSVRTFQYGTEPASGAHASI
jgi:hypothetical protein